MYKYNVSYRKHDDIISTPLTTKQNAVIKYLTMLIINDTHMSELKLLKHLKNGKTLDMTTHINKFLRG